VERAKGRSFRLSASLLELRRIFPLPPPLPPPSPCPPSPSPRWPRRTCIPSQTSPPFVEKPLEMSHPNSLYAPGHSVYQIPSLTLVSRARPPPSSVPRSIYMCGPISQVPQKPSSDSFFLLQGGRLVAERRMVTDIYMFDMETFTWEKLAQSPDSDQPRARYFHSTDACECLNLASRVLIPSLTSFSHSRVLQPQGITI